MEHSFTYGLDDHEKTSWIAFYNMFDQVSVTQFPGWNEATNPTARVCYYRGQLDGLLACACIIIEHKRIADIYWGPLSSDAQLTAIGIEAIRNFYRHKSFAAVRLILRDEISSRSELVEYHLWKLLRFKQHISPLNWSTLRINLLQSIDAIEAGFSTNHRRSIKKMKQQNFVVRCLDSADDINQFATIYLMMHQARKIKPPLSDPARSFIAIDELFRLHLNGEFVGVFNTDNLLVGGVIISTQGNSVFYHFGATHPQFKQLPLLHLAFWHIITKHKSLGFTFFDLGGYNHLAQEGSQVYNINRFKDGFGGQYVFWPRRITIPCFKPLFLALSLFLWVKQRRV